MHRTVEAKEEKFCSSCQQWKELPAFWNNRGAVDGLYATCKECGKKKRAHLPYSYEYTLGYAYNLTKEEYDHMLAAQKGMCAICGKAPEGRRLCVDHSHETGKVRGLLCYRCNIALGYIEDKELMQNATRYLKD